MLGGGMRQAGIIAAAGRYALANNIARLAEDHENAARLGAGLAKHAELKVAPAVTNMVFVVVPENIAAPFTAHLAAEGVRPYGTTRQRWCTHLDVARTDVDNAIACVDQVATISSSAASSRQARGPPGFVPQAPGDPRRAPRRLGRADASPRRP